MAEIPSVKDVDTGVSAERPSTLTVVPGGSRARLLPPQGAQSVTDILRQLPSNARFGGRAKTFTFNEPPTHRSVGNLCDVTKLKSLTKSATVMDILADRVVMLQSAAGSKLSACRETFPLSRGSD